MQRALSTFTLAALLLGCSLLPAFAADSPVPPAPQVARSAQSVCPAGAADLLAALTSAPVPALADEAQKPGDIALFTPEASLAGPCPRIGCPSGFCKQDSDCTAAPGGICDKFCPSNGCCLYP